MHVAECESTQQLLIARASELPEGAIATADHQTAGRGRLGRSWEDAPGLSLLCSVLLRPPATRPAPELSLVTAAATAEAVEQHTGLPAQIKWPNDVILDERKVAGILAEMRGDAIVVGIGINVNQTLDQLPPNTRTAAASLKSVTGREHDVESVLATLLERLSDRYRRGVTTAWTRSSTRSGAELPLRAAAARRRRRRHGRGDRPGRPARDRDAGRARARRERRGRGRAMTDDLAALSVRFMEAVRDRELPFLEYHLGEEFTLTTGRAGAPVRGRAEWLLVTASRYEIEEFAFEEIDAHDYGAAALVRSRYRAARLDGRRTPRPDVPDDRRLGRARRQTALVRHVSPLGIRSCGSRPPDPVRPCTASVLRIPDRARHPSWTDRAGL